MDTFLRNIASYIYGKYGNALSDCAMVFPNRRAGLFFTRHLSEIIEKPLWLPGILNISDLMQSASSLQPADPITLNFELFNVYRSVTGSRESFDEFYNWGEVLLSDFDEIDKYMADAPALFRNVTELKKVDEQFDYLTPGQIEAIKGFWSTFAPRRASPQQKEFLRIWEVLAQIYSGYRDRLTGMGIAYEGMIFRDVAGSVERDALADLPYKKIFIAGFNALNECEKALFDYLRNREMVEFFWDYDNYYISKKGHQAGFFMRGNLSRYPHEGFSQETGGIGNNKNRIEIIAAPSNVGQAKLLSGITGLFKDDHPGRTAIVLPDESLLLPVLSSLPGEVADINVTMGYPLRENPVYGFVMNLISLHRNSRRDAGGGLLYHHGDVLSLLQHPSFREINPVAAEKNAGMITRANQVYIDGAALGDSPFGELVFGSVPEDNGFLDYLTGVLEYIAMNRAGKTDQGRDNDAVGKASGKGEFTGPDGTGASDGEDDTGSLEGFPASEFIYRLITGIARLKDILKNSDTKIGFDTLVKLLKKVLQGLRIPFYGEPLGGVQVMGVLETRALDFENVIWLSMNEGVFPARQHGLSFIPYSLRKGWGLPGIEQQDAVYAYYFYRMMQRTRRTILVYNTRSDGLFTGEMSRFLYQLKFDRQFEITEKSLVSELLPPDDKPIYIEKTPGILRQMQKLAGEGGGKYLSAGALNAFADCSLRFYFRYIARLPEPEKVTGEIDMAMFGTLMHKAAQLIYEPFRGREVGTGDIDPLIAGSAMLEEYVGRAFELVLPDDAKRREGGLTGMEKIISGVIVGYLREMLERDRQLAPFRIEALEKEFRATLSIPGESRELTLNLGGIIDRVDEVAGRLRVVDYKTGGDEPDFKSIPSLFEEGDSRRRKAVFQTFFYAWLYLEDKKPAIPVSPVLYQVKKFFSREPLVIYEKPSRSVKNAVNDFSVYREEFESHLRMLLTGIFDRETPFKQAEDHEVCKYCIYKKICNR